MAAIAASDKLLVERIERRCEGMDVRLCQNARALALSIIELCPGDLERTSALKHLEEVLLWTRAGGPSAGQ